MDKVKEESFSITLSSAPFMSSSSSVQGTVSDFTTQLYKTLNFAENSYEIGLSQIIFKANKALFPGHPSDYSIIVKFRSDINEIETKSLSLKCEITEPFIPTFVSESNDVFENNNVPVLFTAKSNKITIKLTKADTTVSFSPKLKRILGIQSEKIAASETLLGSVDFFRSSNLMLIVCDAMKGQLFGDQHLQIIKTLPNSLSLGAVVNLEFNPIHYYGLARTELSSIRMRVVDENYDLIDFDLEFGITCVLQIKAI